MFAKYLRIILAIGCSGVHTAVFSVGPTTEWSYSEIDRKTQVDRWASDLASPDDPSFDPNKPYTDYPYSLCGTGQAQSPLNIHAAIVRPWRHLDRLRYRYVEDELILVNNGHTIKINTPNDTRSSFFVGLNKFELQQYHFHSPSEHTTGGLTAPMEIHFVNRAPDGEIAVLAAYIREGGEPNEEFEKIIQYVDDVPLAENPEQPSTFSNVIIDPYRLLPKNKKTVFRYPGSFTTPPCSEGVDWYVLGAPLLLSKDQISRFKNYYFGNARPTQDIGSRKILRNPKKSNGPT